MRKTSAQIAFGKLGISPAQVESRGLPSGTGFCLKSMIIAIGLSESSECGCEGHVAQMNSWGPTGCREHREEISGWLKESAEQLSVGQQAKAFVALAAEPWWNPLDPFGSIVDEAIRRSESPPVTSSCDSFLMQ